MFIDYKYTLVTAKEDSHVWFIVQSKFNKLNRHRNPQDLRRSKMLADYCKGILSISELLEAITKVII